MQFAAEDNTESSQDRAGKQNSVQWRLRQSGEYVDRTAFEGQTSMSLKLRCN
jgi:hypothetical protein